MAILTTAKAANTMSADLKNKDNENVVVSVYETHENGCESPTSISHDKHDAEKELQKPSLSLWGKLKKAMRPNTLSDVHSRLRVISDAQFNELQNTDPLKYGKTFLHPKDSLFGRWYDRFTNLVGDTLMFVLTCVIIVVWAILGIVFKAPDNWQIAMQDGSSIQAYFSDSFLMRQQQNEYIDLLQLLCEFKCNATSYLEIFGRKSTLKNTGIPLEQEKSCHKPLTEEQLKQVETKLNSVLGEAQKMQIHNWFDRMSDFLSKIIGSFYTTVIYWIGIFIWVGLGALPYLKFGDTWQLYINTATAVVITFVSMFIQNIRKRHNIYLQQSLSIILHTDAEINYKLRQHSKINDEDYKQNVSIPAEPLSKIAKVVEYYAHVVGGGLGAFISSCVFIVWICIGSPMQWSDNWWLIIGTYTGLIGFVDGFTLRSSYYRYFHYCMKNFDVIADLENELLSSIHLPNVRTRILENKERSFSYRASALLGRWISYSWGVGFAVCVVIALIIIASGLKWSTTGQLICNTPTMIIEGFCLMALLEGHNQNNEKLRIKAHDCLVRKMYLKTYVNNIFTDSESQYEAQGDLKKDLLEENIQEISESQSEKDSSEQV